MRKNIISYALLSIVLFLVSCGENTEYAKVIPTDVDYVATFDGERIMKESGLMDANLSESQLQFKEILKKNLSAGEEELLDKIFSNPQEIGIDWTQKVYAFAPTDKDLKVLLFPVLDEEKLKNSILTFSDSHSKGKSFTDEGAFSYITLNHSFVSITDQACLILVPDGRLKVNPLKEQASIWLNQDDKASFVSSEHYEKLLDLDGEIGLYTNLEGFYKDLSALAGMAYYEDIDISKIKYLVNISFEKGKLVADGKLLFEDAKMREWLQNRVKAAKHLDGTSLSFLPKSTPFWMGVGIDGDDLFNQISEHPVYGKELQKMRLPFDLEGVLRSIDGDLSLSYPHGLYVDVENDEILKICVGAITTMGKFLNIDLKEVGQNQYQVLDKSRTVSRFLRKDVDIMMGMNNDSFFLVSDAKAVKDLKEGETLASAPWAGKVEDNIFFMVFNIQEGENLAVKYVDSRKKKDVAMNYFNYITYGQEDVENSRFELSLVNQERNVIEQLIELYVLNFK